MTKTQKKVEKIVDTILSMPEGCLLQFNNLNGRGYFKAYYKAYHSMYVDTLSIRFFVDGSEYSRHEDSLHLDTFDKKLKENLVLIIGKLIRSKDVEKTIEDLKL